MYSAPSVSYPVGRSRFAGLLALVAWLSGCGTIALWWDQTHEPGWRQGMALVVLAGVGGYAVWTWLRSPEGRLAWESDSWTWSTAKGTESGQVEVRLDLQSRVLLRWQSPGCSAWLWLHGASRPEQWDDLRRALHSPAARETPVSASASAANP